MASISNGLISWQKYIDLKRKTKIYFLQNKRGVWLIPNQGLV